MNLRPVWIPNSPLVHRWFWWYGFSSLQQHANSGKTQARSSRGIGACSNQYIAVQELEMTFSTNSFHGIQPDRHELRRQMDQSQMVNSERKQSCFLSWFQPGRGTARTQRLFYSTSYHCWEQGEGNLFWGEGVPFLLSKDSKESFSASRLSRGFLCELLSSLLYPLSSVLLLLTFFFLCHWCFP